MDFSERERIILNMRFLKYALFLLILFIFLYIISAKGTFGSLPKDGQISLDKRTFINSETTEQKQKRVQPILSQLHQKYKTMNSQTLHKHFEDNPEAWVNYHKISAIDSSIIKIKDIFPQFFMEICRFFKVLQNFEKSSNMEKFGKKMKKSRVQLALNQFFI